MDVIGEHAEKDVRPYPAGQPMVDGADVEVDRLERAEGALDVGEALVGEDRCAGIERLGRRRGAQDVEAVERRLAGDRRVVADEAERFLGDGQPEVLGDLTPSQHGARFQRDLGRAAQRVAGARRRRLDLGEIDVAPAFRTGWFFSYAALARVMSTLACAGVRYPTLEWRRCRL
jgi:hypothetical protein